MAPLTPTPLVQSLGLGQLNCRRLWGRDGSVHDGFMGLVSCLDQLGLQILCVQETQSPLMGGLVGSYGREAGFLLHSSIVAPPIPGTPDLQSLRCRFCLRLSLCLPFCAPHAGIATDTRIQFWCTPQYIVFRQLHSGIPLVLAGDSNIWFPFVQWPFLAQGFVASPIVTLAVQSRMDCDSRTGSGVRQQCHGAG